MHFTQRPFPLCALLCLLLSIAAQAETLLNESLRTASDNRKLSHFRGDAVLTATDHADGIVLAPTHAGMIVDTFAVSVPKPTDGSTRIRVNFRVRSTHAQLPLVVCVARFPGAASPAIKKPLKLVPDGQWHDFALDFDIASLLTIPESVFTLEFIMEGGVDAQEAWQLADLTVETLPPPPFQITAVPHSGNLPVGFGDETIRLRVKVNSGAPQLTAVLLDDNMHREIRRTALDGRVGESCEAVFPLHELPVGNYLVTLLDGEKEVARFPFRRFAPKPDAFLIVDGVPYYRGKPFFAIGIYHASDPVIDIVNRFNAEHGLPAVSREEMLKNLHERHFNFIHHSWTPGSPEFHRAAAAEELLVLNEVVRQPEDLDKYRRMAAVLDQPNLMGWIPFDEPQSAWAEECAGLYDRFSRLDPNHPNFVAFEAGAYGLGDRALADVACQDCYKVGSPDVDLSILGELADAVTENVIDGDPSGCLFMVPQLFRADGTSAAVTPSPEQVLIQAYLGILHGAKGIIYYAYFTTEPAQAGMERNPERKYWYLPETPLWDTIGEVNARLAADGDFFLVGRPADGVRFTGLPQARAWRLDDRLLVLAVNPSGREPLRGNVHLPPEWTEGRGAADVAVELPPYGVFRQIYRR